MEHEKIKITKKGIEEAKWEFQEENLMKNRFARFLRGRKERVHYNINKFTYVYHIFQENEKAGKEDFEEIKPLVKKIQEIQKEYQDKIPTASISFSYNNKTTGDQEIIWKTARSERFITFNFNKLTAIFDASNNPSRRFIAMLIGELGLPIFLK